MKKLLAGCLIVAALGLAALGVAGYFGYRAVRPMIDGATTWAQQAREMAAASDRITNKTDFNAPADGKLDDGRVRRFLAVQERVKTALGPRWAELEARGREFEVKARAGGRDLSLTEVGTMLSGLGTLLVDARRTQVDALNAEGFSSGEYSWTRLRIYQAAGLELADGVDWSALEGLIKRGADQASVNPPELKLPEIPEVNRTLVKPHVEALQTWLPLAMLGF
ncbi:MAG TPA: hypothetical protein PLH72_14660 [Vicinamibacterales bacterium]|nr:hypothetical protein [Vicinamibacterales bacterium]